MVRTKWDLFSEICAYSLLVGAISLSDPTLNVLDLSDVVHFDVGLGITNYTRFIQA